MTDDLFIVQPYVAKARGLVAQSARVFVDEASARRAGSQLARFRAGVVVLSQSVDPITLSKGRPSPLAVHGQVPADWGALASAA